jgi:hypothetical protein
MANSGLSTFLYAPLQSGGTYGTVSKLAGAIAYKETINLNNYKHYEDNALQWEDNSFKDGNINLTIGDDDTAIFSGLLGRQRRSITVGATTKCIYVGSIEDISKPVGFGFIENIRTEAGFKYAVKFYPSVAFKPYSTEGKTKSENNTYTTQAVDGTISTVDGDYIFNERYDTMNEAIGVLYACFGAQVPANVKNADLAALTIGNLALSPTFNAGVTDYTAVTAAATNTITAASVDATATVAIKNGTETVANEASATWTAGENVVTITITNGSAVKTYTVTVIKTA